MAGLKVDQAKRLKEFEKAQTLLKPPLVAELVRLGQQVVYTDR